MKILNNFLTNPLVIASGLICTLTGKSIFFIASKAFKLFGMSLHFHQNAADIWDFCTKCILASLVVYAIIRQRKQSALIEQKIGALRQLRDIDVQAFFHHVKDLNAQNAINNEEITKGFQKVGVTISKHKERQTSNLIDIINNDISEKQAFLNEILDSDV